MKQYYDNSNVNKSYHGTDYQTFSKYHNEKYGNNILNDDESMNDPLDIVQIQYQLWELDIVKPEIKTVDKIAKILKSDIDSLLNFNTENVTLDTVVYFLSTDDKRKSRNYQDLTEEECKINDTATIIIMNRIKKYSDITGIDYETCEEEMRNFYKQIVEDTESDVTLYMMLNTLGQFLVSNLIENLKKINDTDPTPANVKTAYLNMTEK